MLILFPVGFSLFMIEGSFLSLVAFVFFLVSMCKLGRGLVLFKKEPTKKKEEFFFFLSSLV